MVSGLQSSLSAAFAMVSRRSVINIPLPHVTGEKDRRFDPSIFCAGVIVLNIAMIHEVRNRSESR